MKNVRAFCVVAGLVISMIGFGCSATAFAQSGDVKIGYVDLQRVIDASEDGKRAQEEIKKKADELSQQAKAMKEEIQQIKQNYEKQNDVLTDEAKREKRDEISKMERDYTRFINDSKTELRLAEQRALKELLEGVGKLVVEYGKANNYTAIFEAGNILYGADSIELTQEIINLYNSKK